MSQDRATLIASRIRKVQEYVSTNPERKAVKDAFIEKFILCEMGCKEAMLDYWHAKGKKLDVMDTEGIRLLPDVIKNALGPGTVYDFTEDFLLRMFGGKDNKQNPYKTKEIYSAKILRDKITHELLTTAIDEVFERWESLSSMMDEFLGKLDVVPEVEP